MYSMGQYLNDRFQDIQRRYRDPLLTFLTALLLILFFVVAPLDAAGVTVFEVVGFIIALAMIGGALVVSASPVAFTALLIAFCMNGAAAILRIRTQSSLDLYLVAGAWSILAVTLGWVVSRAVFGPGRVNYHRVVGAILLYLLIGLLFVSLFVFVGGLIPKSFSGVAVEDSNKLASNMIYFSFVTLTSTGYGDVLPLHPMARSLCNLESIIGQLYPATLLARLVTLELGNRQQ
jgi:Ion channel